MIFHRESTGFPLNAVREIKFLKFLSHRSIVQLKEVVTAKGCEERELPVKSDHKGETTSSSNKKAKKEEGNSSTTTNPTTSVVAHNEENDGKDILKLCGNLYFVFEYIEHDLSGLIDSKYSFQPREIKCIMKQLFEALEYLHEKRIIHRDIKTSNILISNDHRVKLADFGLARQMPYSEFGREVTRSEAPLTNNVITLWYRPPELLLGATKYTTSVDIWSAGCVMAELELGRPFMVGRTELEQLDCIFRTFGSPSEDTWPGLTTFPNYDKFYNPSAASSANTTTTSSSSSGKTRGGGGSSAPVAGMVGMIGIPSYGNTVRSLPLSDSSFHLFDRIFVYDPNRRSSAKGCLTNVYFLTRPLAPSDPRELEPLAVNDGQSFHEYETKQQRKKDEELKKQQQQQQQVLLDQQRIEEEQRRVTTAHPPPPPPPPLFPPPSHQPSYYPPHPPQQIPYDRVTGKRQSNTEAYR